MPERSAILASCSIQEFSCAPTLDSTSLRVRLVTVSTTTKAYSSSRITCSSSSVVRFDATDSMLVSMPILRAQSSGKSQSAFTYKHGRPCFIASLIICIARAVFPVLAGPNSSVIPPTGRPPPNLRSSNGNPVLKYFIAACAF